MVEKLLRLDQRLSATLRLERSRSHLAWYLAAFFAHSGDSWFWLAALILVWLLVGGEWHHRAALLAVAILTLAVIVMAIKFTVRRSRPPGEWGAIYRNTDPHSFPSGHAARAVLLLVMAWGLGPAWFAWIMTAWAPLVCLARVSTGLHYLSDVIAGILVGLAAGVVILELQPLLISLLPFLF